MKFKNNARDGSGLCVSVSVCSCVCACIVYVWYCTPRIYVFVDSSSVFLGILHYVLFTGWNRTLSKCIVYAVLTQYSVKWVPYLDFMLLAPRLDIDSQVVSI